MVGQASGSRPKAAGGGDAREASGGVRSSACVAHTLGLAGCDFAWGGEIARARVGRGRARVVLSLVVVGRAAEASRAAPHGDIALPCVGIAHRAHMGPRVVHVGKHLGWICSEILNGTLKFSNIEIGV